MNSCSTDKQWQDMLDDISPNMGLYRPSWFESWLTAYKNEGSWKGSISNYACMIDGKLNAVFPACTQKFGPLNFISLAGSYFPVRAFPSHQITTEICEQLLKQFSDRSFVAGVRMGPVSLSDQNIMSLVEYFKQSGWQVLSRKVGNDYVLATDGVWDSYEANMSKKRRQKLRYYWRKILNTGNVELIHDTDLSSSDWAEVFISLADVERQSWVGQKGDCRFLGDKNQIYWNSLVQDEWFRRAIKVWRIIRDQKTVSFALTIDVGSRRFVYANSYIESVTKFSTGSKIYYHLIQSAFEGDIREIHFGLGDSGYKSMWNAMPENVLTDLIIIPPTLIGKCTLLLVRLRGFDAA